MRWQVRCFMSVIICMLIPFFSGCDFHLQLDSAPVTVTNDVVTSSGRGGYDWQVLNGKFEVARSSTYGVAEKIDRVKLKSNWVNVKFVERSATDKPSAMDDDVWEWFSRLELNHAEPRLLMELEKGPEVGVDPVCFNQDGTRMWTIAGKLIEWDVDTGKRLRSFDAPMKECKSIQLDASGQSIVLQNAERILRISLADNATLGQWRPSKGSIESMAMARDADAFGVVTTGSKLQAITQNFSKMVEFSEVALSFNRIAIHPKGNWILGVTKRGFLRWKFGDRAEISDYYRSEIMPMDFSVPMAGTVWDRWIDQRVLHEFLGPVRLQPTTSMDYLSINAAILAAENATVDGTQDWMVLHIQKGNLESPEDFLIDVSQSEFLSSVPWRIPLRGARFIGGNSSMERVALVANGKLKVYYRRRWLNLNGIMTAQKLAGLLLAGRIEQIEICAKEVKQINVDRGGNSGLDLYRFIAEYLGRNLISLDNSTGENTNREAIQQWQRSGSELAILASAARHLAIRAEARGTKTADTVSPEAWRTHEKETKLAFKDLKPLIAMENPPYAAIELWTRCAVGSDLDRSSAEGLLQRSAELYPNQVQPFVNMSLWLLPRWGGNTGDGAALISSIAKRFPKPEGEVFYARVAMGLSEIVGAGAIVEEGGFSAKRILDAVDLVLERNPTRDEVELLLDLANKSGFSSAREGIAKFHYAHFEIPSEHVYRRILTQPLWMARKSAFVETGPTIQE